MVTALRSQHAATLLNDRRVLLAGGTIDGETGLTTTETFDPLQVRFAPGLPLQAGRFGEASAYLSAQDLLMLVGVDSKALELITAPWAASSWTTVKGEIQRVDSSGMHMSRSYFKGASRNSITARFTSSGRVRKVACPLPGTINSCPPGMSFAMWCATSTE